VGKEKILTNLILIAVVVLQVNTTIKKSEEHVFRVRLESTPPAQDQNDVRNVMEQDNFKTKQDERDVYNVE
jgi:hypothetical protein